MKKNNPQTFYWNAKELNGIKPGSSAHFFSEDMGRDARFYHGRDKSVEFELIPGEKTFTEKLAPILSIDRHYSGFRHHDLTESVKSLIESITSNLFFFGNAYYELYESKDGLRLLNISNHTIRDFLGFYFQILPIDLAKERNNNSRINIIDRTNITKFTFPKKLGGARRLKQIKSELHKTDFNIYLKEMNLHMQGKGSKYFDQEHFQYKRKIIMAKYCYDLGWYQRGIDISDLNEYSQIRLVLNQKKTTAIVRQDVIDQINVKLLPKILKRLKMENTSHLTIKSKKMENTEYYDDLLNDLKTGRKSIKKLREIIFTKSNSYGSI